MARVAPDEVVECERNGTISSSLRPYARESIAESGDIAAALGGLDLVSEQRQIMMADIARAGLVLRVLIAQFLQNGGDPELAPKISSLIGQRRASLQALGLDRVQRDALDLASYIESRSEAAQSGAARTNGGNHSAGPRRDHDGGRGRSPGGRIER